MPGNYPTTEEFREITVITAVKIDPGMTMVGRDMRSLTDARTKTEVLADMETNIGIDTKIDHPLDMKMIDTEIIIIVETGMFELKMNLRRNEIV